MKTNSIRTITAVILCMTSFSTMLRAQTYCTPPPFSSGPYTGITNVKLDVLDNTSSYEDGVKYFMKTALPRLSRGSSQEVSVTTYHGILGIGFSDKLSVRVWIDWNQDGDFSDANEEVLKYEMANPGLVKQAFVVPANATIGTTRMRVYNDMPPVDGHDPATPCGYLGSPNLALGQHGEVEDYNVQVTAASSVEESSLLSKEIRIFPNPGNDFSLIEVTTFNAADLFICVTDAQGKIIENLFDGRKESGMHSFFLETADLTAGIYLVKVTANGFTATSKLRIVH